MEASMRELRSEQIGNRRVRLLAEQDGRYAVTLELRGPHGSWQDASIATDRHLGLHTASLCYRLRLIEPEARAIEWNRE
jgi:hypothetical protein